MKVLHSIYSMGLYAGGPTLSTFLTVQGLRDRGEIIDILTYQVSKASDKPISSEDFIHTLPSVNNSFCYSKEFKKFLLQNPYDLYHTQGIWLYPSYITPKIARKYKKPYIISPRGSLYPQDLAKGKLKKTIFLKLFLFNDLQKAACVHATCREEMEHLRNLGVKSPIAVIPNPINISLPLQIINQPDKVRVGYLGRVHPRKNIDRLIYAWSKLGDKVKNCELVIIGARDEQYMQFLKSETQRLNLTNVLFTGFLTGTAKEKALDSLSYLAVPSDFENFGNIVTESLVRGIPVIASKGTPWEELNIHNCGWWVDNDVDTLTSTIEQAISLSDEERIQMGLRGQELMKNHYSVEIVSEKMKTLYQWILNGGQQPDFVFLQ